MFLAKLPFPLLLRCALIANKHSVTVWYFLFLFLFLLSFILHLKIIRESYAATKSRWTKWTYHESVVGTKQVCSYLFSYLK